MDTDSTMARELELQAKIFELKAEIAELKDELRWYKGNY